jgi:hypothetical protein
MTNDKTVAQGWVPIQHGIPSSYNRGCRCDECKDANAARARRTKNVEHFRKRNFARRVLVNGVPIAPLPDDRHGTCYTYNRYSCRCAACVEAKRFYTHQLKARGNENPPSAPRG